MSKNLSKITLGGGCHWCTEAIFQSLKGVAKVEQGFVASYGEYSSQSEGVIVHFDKGLISLENLIEIHLHTHESTSNHSMRAKYRSAIYTFDTKQSKEAHRILGRLNLEFKGELITTIIPFKNFIGSDERYVDYYFKDPKRPFCEVYIHPKLQLLLSKFSGHINPKKLEFI